MFSVAVCDDEMTICNEIEHIIINYSKQIVEKLDVEIFDSAEDLWTFLKNEHTFDLIFLDIKMKLMDGIKFGRKIREELKDEITQIVYISAKQEYAMDLFESRPLNFLIKPIKARNIEKCLHKAYELMRQRNLFFEFSVRRTLYKIKYADIIFFESENKKVRIVTNNEIYEYYGKLEEVSEKIPSKEFLQIHKSYIVNYLYILEAQYEELQLINDTILPISQPYRKEVRNKLIERRKNMG